MVTTTRAIQTTKMRYNFPAVPTSSLSTHCSGYMGLKQEPQFSNPRVI